MKERRGKQISVETVIEKANQYLAAADYESKLTPNNHVNGNTRTAIHSFVEALLMDAKAYHGFNYQAWRDGGAQQWKDDGQPDETTPYLGDQTRTFFY